MEYNIINIDVLDCIYIEEGADVRIDWLKIDKAK